MSNWVTVDPYSHNVLGKDSDKPANLITLCMLYK